MRSGICLWVIIASLLPVFSYAQNQDKSLVLELYNKSGMEKQLGQLPTLLLSQLDQFANEGDEDGKVPDSVLSAMKAAIPTVFAPEKLREATLAELAEKLTVKDIKEVLEWLGSPIGKKCTQLEEAASTPEVQAEMEQYASYLKKAPPTPERLTEMRDFDSAIKGSETAVEVAFQTEAAIILALNATLPKEKQRSHDAVFSELEKSRPALEKEVRAQTLVELLYTYKSLTEAEIRRYTEFSKSPVGSKYGSVAIAAFKKVYLEGAVKWGKLVGNSIQDITGHSDA